MLKQVEFPMMYPCHNDKIGTHFHFRFASGYVSTAFVCKSSGRKSLFRALSRDKEINMEECKTALRILRECELSERAKQDIDEHWLSGFIVLFSDRKDIIDPSLN